MKDSLSWNYLLQTTKEIRKRIKRIEAVYEREDIKDTILFAINKVYEEIGDKNVQDERVE